MKQKKETDPRVKEYLVLYSEVLYPKMTGKPYMVSWAKEGKLMKQALRYFDKFKPNEKETFESTATEYLKSQDPYINKQGWPISLLLSKPHAFLKKTVRKEIQAPETPKWTHESIRYRWDSVDTEAYVQKALEKAYEDPIGFTKGFVLTQGLLKKLSPEKWRAVGSALKELVGEERFAHIWRNPPQIGA